MRDSVYNTLRRRGVSCTFLLCILCHFEMHRLSEDRHLVNIKPQCSICRSKHDLGSLSMSLSSGIKLYGNLMYYISSTHASYCKKAHGQLNVQWYTFGDIGVTALIQILLSQALNLII